MLRNVLVVVVGAAELMKYEREKKRTSITEAKRRFKLRRKCGEEAC